MPEASSLQLLNHFWVSAFFLIPMVLVARAVVSGTRYSPILIVVIFGLAMGGLLVFSGLSSPGLPDFPVIDFMGKATIVALVASFFVGGQELRRILGKHEAVVDDSVVYSKEESFLGTGRTQLVLIVRAFFLLLGIEGLMRTLLGGGTGPLGQHYPLLAYLGLVVSVILIDNKAVIGDRKRYLRKGLAEIVGIVAVLALAHAMAGAVRPLVALPQIFFAMLLSAGLGALLWRWRHGPTIRSLLFAGIPVVLAASFMIGGSRIGDAFVLDGMGAVLGYGFFGQVFWMFGGMALLMLVGRGPDVRHLGPGMAGALSHAGLTGACTAGDLGEQAARRAPIMINIPFFGHVFVFSILAMSLERGALLFVPAAIIVAVGAVLTVLGLRSLRGAGGDDGREVKALMQFSFGWQLFAVFGGLILLGLSPMSLDQALMAKSSALSHFGLFAAIQGGMAGAGAAALIAFVFAMPFLVHPLVFFMFGRAMERGGTMPTRPAVALAVIGLVGVTASLLLA